jgi:NADH dehydrogenase FAD-containing subunit
MTGLATDERGYIAVDRQLRSRSHPEVFGGGDIVTLIDDPHPKSGVFAVRHGPILAANLRAALQEDAAAMRAYVPQQHALSLIGAGNKYAVASWGRWSVSGNWVWAWKDRIDRRFIARYKVT